MPVVKARHIATGLDCDMCINNKLAVENTMLLRDHALLDRR